MAAVERVVWRLIDSGPGAATWNMAVDEALLEVAEASEGAAPVLRLYRWEPAAISLGRFQAAADVTPPPGVDLVRRLSGGSAIYHRSDELTYSVVAPYALFGDRKPRTAYRAIHAALARGLRALGVKVEGGGACRAPRAGMCFDHATADDLVVGGRKLLGSAQRRRGRWFLQHGSLPLSPDPLSPGAISLSELLGTAPTLARVGTAVVKAFDLGDLRPDALRETEASLAERLARERYGRGDWTHAR